MDDLTSSRLLKPSIGMLYELPIESSFTTDVGLSVNNLIEMDMDNAEDIKRTINLGVATRR